MPNQSIREPHAPLAQRHQPRGSVPAITAPFFSRRATHDVEDRLSRLSVKNWVTTAYQRKWRWAQEVATMSSDRWAQRAASWTPEWNQACRKQARPRKRWEDDIKTFLANKGMTADWKELACTPVWPELEAEYLELHM